MDRDKGGAQLQDLPLGVLQLAAVFEGLPLVMFSIKGIDGRYLRVNQAFADRAGRKSPAQVIGRTAADLFPPELAISYAAQDAALLGGGGRLSRQLELISRPDGQLGWYVTNKTLLRDNHGAVVAVAAVSVDEELPAARVGMAGVEAAVALIRQDFGRSLSASDLAAVAGVSVATLERRIRRLFGVPPRQLIVRIRVEEAVQRIVDTDLSLAMVAAQCGFSDQAAMSRQVKGLLGVTPSQLRAAGAKPVD